MAVTRSIRFETETYTRLVAESSKRDVSFQWLVHKLIGEALDRLGEPKEFKVTR